MEHVFMVGHSQVREAIGNQFNLTILEPNGITLLSTIKKAASSLGIGNHIHAGYLIVIEFNGRMPNGAAKRYNQVFYYGAIITDFTFKVDEGGSRYHIAMVEQFANGYRYTTNQVRSQITIVAETVGEFFEKFEDSMNASLLDLWATNPVANQYPAQVRFEFDDSAAGWKNWRFQVLDNPFSVGTANFIGLPEGSPKLQVTVNNGSDISSIFSYVLQLTAEYKNILVEQGKSSSNNTFARKSPTEFAENIELDSFPVFMKVLTNVEFGDFDVLAGEYSKTTVFKLKAYTVTGMVIDSGLYSRGITNASIQSNRIKNLISNGYLRKRYDYIYTGRNTEILDLEMDFNFSYYEILPYGQGYFGDPDVQSPVILKDGEEVISRLSQIGAMQQELSVAAQNVIAAKANLNGPEGATELSAQRVINENKRTVLNSAIQEEISFLQSEYGLNPQEISYQLRWVQDAVGGQDASGSDNDTKSGTLKAGAVKVNLETSADFHTIELGIRGDPYWMGVPSSFTNLTQNTDDLVNYESGSANFFLNVGLPVSEEDATGRRPPSPDYQLSGIFRVLNCISRFQNGQFTQHLKATRDMASNTSTIWNQLVNDDVAIRNSGLADIAARD
jgi:hypothetical protein